MGAQQSGGAQLNSRQLAIYPHSVYNIPQITLDLFQFGSVLTSGNRLLFLCYTDSLLIADSTLFPSPAETGSAVTNDSIGM